MFVHFSPTVSNISAEFKSSFRLKRGSEGDLAWIEEEAYVQTVPFTSKVEQNQRGILAFYHLTFLGRLCPQTHPRQSAATSRRSA